MTLVCHYEKSTSNQKAIKKLFRTAIFNFIFGYTRVPFRHHSVYFLPFIELHVGPE